VADAVAEEGGRMSSKSMSEDGRMSKVSMRTALMPKSSSYSASNMEMTEDKESLSEWRELDASRLASSGTFSTMGVTGGTAEGSASGEEVDVCSATPLVCGRGWSRGLWK
jgi:hypothetical protein